MVVVVIAVIIVVVCVVVVDKGFEESTKTAMALGELEIAICKPEALAS